MSNILYGKNTEKMLDSIQKLFNKKNIAIFGLATLSGLAPFTYDTLKDAYLENNLLRESKVINYVENHKALNKNTKAFIEQNLDNYNKLKDLCLAYRELQLEKDSTRLQESLLPVAKNEMIENLDNFVSLALSASKAKFGDAFDIDSSGITITPYLKDGFFNVKSNRKNIYYSSINENLELIKLIKNLSLLQNHEVNGENDKTKTANNLYSLFNSTTKVLNNNYMLSKDNKMIEVSYQNGKNINKNEKSHELEI